MSLIISLRTQNSKLLYIANVKAKIIIFLYSFYNGDSQTHSPSIQSYLLLIPAYYSVC